MTGNEKEESSPGANKFTPPPLSSFHKSDERFCARPSTVQRVKLRIHHGGIFVNNPSTLYIKGRVDEMNWGWDVDHMSHIEVSNMVKSLGYLNFKCLWYQHTKLSLTRGLRPLNSDADILKLVEDCKGFEVTDIYVEHLIDVPIAADKENNEEQNVHEEADVIDVDSLDEGDDDGDDDEDGEGDDDGDDEGDGEADGEGDDDGDEVENIGEKVVVETDSEEDSDYVAGSHSDSENMEDSDFDEDWDWTTVLPPETVNEVKRNVANAENPTTVAEFEASSDDSDQLDTPPGSDDDDEASRPKFPKFRMPEGHNTVRFEVGLMFNNKETVRDAVKEYAMEHKKNLHFTKNDKKRMVVKCMKGCPFYLRISMRSTTEYWQVVSLNNEHSCHRTARNRQATTGWLAKKFIPTLTHTPDIQVKTLVAEALQKWGVRLSHNAAWRAKQKALEKIQGAGKDQYTHLRSYAEELRRSNPNSTVIIKCGLGGNGPVFERIYVCFEACKAAFAYCCRPLIGLDVCFLKGEFGGQLMAAVGKDGNNMMIPIAYAVVEAETRDSWSWFINLLLEDLNGIQYRTWSFISYQQKGLVPAIKDLGEQFQHRLCVKHLYGNWRKKYPGVEMKEVLWEAARATTVETWQRVMNKMKEMNEAAWRDMMALPPGAWTKSAYSAYPECDLQVNNMCEAFNSAILKFRDKPIITLLEELKFYITDRIVQQKALMQRYKGDICPKIQKALEKLKRKSEGWKPYWHGDDDHRAIFSVDNGTDKYVVNLLEKKCACRKWQLSGIPCCHAVACLWHNNVPPEQYVSSYYRKTTFLATYSYLIMPSNGPKLWPLVDAQPILPPLMRRAPGRPRKQRFKANDEPRDPHRLPRLLPTVKCKKCGKLGHNVRTCKGKTAADREIPKGGNKKLKKQKRTHVGEGSNSAHGETAHTEAAAQADAAPAAQAEAEAAQAEAAQPEPAQADNAHAPEEPTILSQCSQAPPQSQAYEAS